MRSDGDIKSLLAGAFNEEDCKALDNATNTEGADRAGDAACVRLADGSPDARSDCGRCGDNFIDGRARLRKSDCKLSGRKDRPGLYVHVYVCSTMNRMIS